MAVTPPAGTPETPETAPTGRPVRASRTVRCAAHPARPAVGACPVCGRPRCGADPVGDACAVCGGADTAARPARTRGAVTPVRAGLALAAGALVALLGAFVGAEYVQAGLLGYLVPAVAGVMVGGVTLAVARSAGRGQTGAWLRAAAALLALGSAVLAAQLEGSQALLAGGNLLPYACAVAGALLWTQPPRRRTPKP